MDEYSKNKLVIVAGAKFSELPFIDKLASQFCYEKADKPSALITLSVAVIIVDAQLLAAYSVDQWREVAPQALMIAEEHVTDQADFYVPSGMPQKVTLSVVAQACQQWLIQRQAQQMKTALATEHQQILQLTNIGIALSAEKNLHRLLKLILEEGSRLACCDAASLYLVDSAQPDNPQLIFKLTHNYSIKFPFEEKTMPIDKKSLAGYVVATGEVVNIDDAYDLPVGVPYILNKWFDETMSYRTMSMVVIPMKNYRGEVIGALQFINRKKEYDIKLLSLDIVNQSVIPFDEKVIDLLRALASQAAVSIENDTLIERIHILFDGFVRASVHAIEQRDPTTSGHSFRVADLTTQLATSLPRSSKSIFKDVVFSDEDIREIRFASLLHDFGKVGVREHVLVKEKKLPSHRLELIRHRVALEKERLYRFAAEQEVLLLRTMSPQDGEQQKEQLAKQLLEKIERLNMLLKVVLESNEPSVLPEESSSLLQEVHQYPYKNIDEKTSGLIDQEELLALSVKKGSLTNDERKEIESHVTHTLKFLSLIPWTPELSRIPAIAASHHEKLNGGGYPVGLKADQIPLPSKLMAICDIFDALTASDRPYKPAVPLEKALGILEIEAKGGFIDKDAVDVFIDAKVYNAINDKDYTGGLHYQHIPRHAHHVCDADVHDHDQSLR
jgi:HD-GYP domain-containing protein (c-di-GMP phosphodiesterase class II)